MSELSGFIQRLEHDTNSFIHNLPELIKTEKQKLKEKQAELGMLSKNLETVGTLVTPKGIPFQKDAKFITLELRVDRLQAYIGFVLASNDTKIPEWIPSIQQLTQDYNALVAELADFEEGLEALEG